MAGMVTAPAMIILALAALLVAPNSLPVMFLIFIVWGMGFSATVLLYQQTPPASTWPSRQARVPWNQSEPGPFTERT